MIDTRESDDLDTVRRNIARIVDETSKENDALVKELLAVYDRESKLLGGIRKRDKEITKLKTQLAQRDTKLASVNERLERLLESKAMRLQRAYWRFRRPNGSAGTSAGAR
ncbi:hypothetical protein ACFXPS_45085 [Nocardia sp. NPDC059091]|uniref:Uncharacterized protein n=1 Tax=Brevibacterium casei TaxID=33889 RepID=A0A7T4DJC3_9MICO|nr:hypothetical protein [Brevibacterium casei]QQB15442.1 hypothetical protein I6H47_05730 [Brevibacterium casei]